MAENPAGEAGLNTPKGVNGRLYAALLETKKRGPGTPPLEIQTLHTGCKDLKSSPALRYLEQVTIRTIELWSVR